MDKAATTNFRAGQWESIDALTNQRQKLLIIQRTGWDLQLLFPHCWR